MGTATASTTTTAAGTTTEHPDASLIGHVRARLKEGKDIERPTEEAVARARPARRGVQRADGRARRAPASRSCSALAHGVPVRRGAQVLPDYWFQSRFFNKVREFGALLAKHGFIEDGEDIFQLSRHEAMQALGELSLTGRRAGRRWACTTGRRSWRRKS